MSVPAWFMRHHGRGRNYSRPDVDDPLARPLEPDEVFYCETNHRDISRAPGRAVAKLPSGAFIIQLRSAVYDRAAARVVTRVALFPSQLKQIEALDAIAQEIFEE